MTPITERPTGVTSRTVPGHWEGDLLKGARNGSAVGTLVERTTRLVLLARMDGTDAVSAYRGFTKKLRGVPTPLRKTLTYDRGKEIADHLSIQVFIADPRGADVACASTSGRTEVPESDSVAGLLVGALLVRGLAYRRIGISA